MTRFATLWLALALLGCGSLVSRLPGDAGSTDSGPLPGDGGKVDAGGVADSGAGVSDAGPLTCSSNPFTLVTRRPIACRISPLWIADFDHDGHPDVLTLEGNGGALDVYPGDGDGGFGTTVVSNTGLASPYLGAVADLDGDGWLDLVVRAGYQPEYLSAVYGAAGGTFGTVQTLFQNPGNDLSAVAPVDFDHDGVDDLVVSHSWTDTLDLLQRDAGAYSALAGLPVLPGAITQLYGADMNGDGLPDLVLGTGGTRADAGTGSVTVYLNQGDGGFASRVTLFPTGWSPLSLDLADVNHDGHLDAITESYPVGGIAVLFNDGTGQLTAPVMTGSDFPGALAVGDLDRDGFPDLVGSIPSNNSAIPDQLGIWINDGGSYAPPVLRDGGFDIMSLQLADLNGDGRPDLVYANYESADAGGCYLNVELNVCGR